MITFEAVGKLQYVKQIKRRHPPAFVMSCRYNRLVVQAILSGLTVFALNRTVRHFIVHFDGWILNMLKATQ